MPYAVCPNCDEDIRLTGRPKVGDIVYCPSCEIELEVVNLDPLELDLRMDDDDELGYDDEDEDEDERDDEDDY